MNCKLNMCQSQVSRCDHILSHLKSPWQQQQLQVSSVKANYPFFFFFSEPKYSCVLQAYRTVCRKNVTGFSLEQEKAFSGNICWATGCCDRGRARILRHLSSGRGKGWLSLLSAPKLVGVWLVCFDGVSLMSELLNLQSFHQKKKHIVTGMPTWAQSFPGQML